MSYRVDSVKYGRIIKGTGIPVEDLCALTKAWGPDGFIDFLITWSLQDCLMALPYDKKSSKAWREELKSKGRLYSGPINGVPQNV